MSTQKLNWRIGWAAIILAVIIAAAYFIVARSGLGNLPFFIPATVALPMGDLPGLPNKPEPQLTTFDNCPPSGMGGDSGLNILKNRVDAGNYKPVSFDTLLTLTWPKNVEQLSTKDWSADGRAFIARYAGIPIMVEGYFGAIKENPPESANCNLANSSNKDWSIFFTKNPRDDLSQSVIVSVTPRIRASHKWTLDLLRSRIISDHYLMRVSGWLLFNPEHPQDVGKTRATLWEIHPVIQIEVFNNGRWITLDKFAG